MRHKVWVFAMKCKNYQSIQLLISSWMLAVSLIKYAMCRNMSGKAVDWKWALIPCHSALPQSRGPCLRRFSPLLFQNNEYSGNQKPLIPKKEPPEQFLIYFFSKIFVSICMCAHLCMYVSFIEKNVHSQTGYKVNHFYLSKLNC